MKVVTTEDYEDMPAGSCLQEAKLINKGRFFVGLWCSYGGSYRVKVPAEICKEWKDPFEELFEYLEQNPPEPEPTEEREGLTGDERNCLLEEIFKALEVQGVAYPDVTITTLPDDKGPTIEFEITVWHYGQAHSMTLKIMKRQLVERRYDILKRMAQIAVMDMFPKMPQKESTLDRYFEEREKKERREKWINQF